jgi:hypothetical protein
MSNNSNSVEFYNQTKVINYYICLYVIILGLIGNTITITSLLQVTDLIKFKCGKPGKFYRRESMTSAKTYMLALAVFDNLFLISHLIEDIIPSTSSHIAYQFINRSEIICKFVLHLRNSTRIISCYLGKFISVFNHLEFRFLFENVKKTTEVLKSTEPYE